MAMRCGVRRTLGLIFSLFLILFSLAGCHPAQLRMPELQIKPSLTLAVPATSASASGPLKVMGVAFRPGHDQIAAGYSDGHVRLWDIAARRVIHEFDYGHEVRAIAFSADGRKLAAAGGSYSDDPDRPGAVRIWDVESGTFEVELRGRRGPVDALAWSGGARPLIAASYFYGEQRIYVWNPADGAIVQQISAGSSGDPTVSFTDDGRFLCVGGNARIYEITGDKPSTFTEVPVGHLGSVTVLPAIDRCFGVIPSQLEQLWPLCVVNGCGKPSELWTGPLKNQGEHKSWGLPAQLDGNPTIATSESASLLAISEPTGSSAILIWDVKKQLLPAALIDEPGSRLGDAALDKDATRVVGVSRMQGVIYLWDLAALNRGAAVSASH